VIPQNAGHNNLYYRRLTINKYIGFDIDSKKAVACVAQKGKKDRFTTLKTGIEQMKNFLQKWRKPNAKSHPTFEISGGLRSSIAERP